MRIGLLAVCLVAIPVVAALPACGADDSYEEETGEDVAPIVSSRAFAIDAEPGVDVELRGSDLVFPAPLRQDVAVRANGDVIASARGAGFLRRIVGRHDEGDRVVVETTPAALEDAFEQMRLRGSLTREAAGAARSATLGTTANKRLALPPLEVHDLHLPLGETGSLDIVDGLFELSPDIDVDLLVKARSVERFKLTVGADARTRLRVRYDLQKESQSIQTKRKGEPALASMPPKYVLFWIGGFPVLLAVHVDLEADATFVVTGAVTGEASVEADGSMTAGVDYQKGTFKNVSSSSFKVGFGTGDNRMPTWQLGGEVQLTAKVSVEVYDLAGPYVGLQTFASVTYGDEGKGKKARGEVGIRGLVGAEAGIFNREVSYEKQVFQRSLRTGD